MDPLLIITILILIGCTLLLILYPLWQRTQQETHPQNSAPGHSVEEYEVRYQALLADIRELTFDYEMGKVSSQDYETYLPSLKLKAAEVRQLMDQSGNHIPADLDTEIEALIAQFRNGNDPVQPQDIQQKVKAELALLKNRSMTDEPILANESSPQPINCSACGIPLQADDAFCSKCGQPVPSSKAQAKTDCPQCGAAIQPDDAFCTKCGFHLKTATPQNQET